MRKAQCDGVETRAARHPLHPSPLRLHISISTSLHVCVYFPAAVKQEEEFGRPLLEEPPASGLTPASEILTATPSPISLRGHTDYSVIYINGYQAKASTGRQPGGKQNAPHYFPVSCWSTCRAPWSVLKITSEYLQKYLRVPLKPSKVPRGVFLRCPESTSQYLLRVLFQSVVECLKKERPLAALQ